MNFITYFYHDVQIESIIYSFNKNNEDNSIIFSLNEFNDDGDIIAQSECIFVDIFTSYSSLIHNFTGGLFIMEAKIDNKDKDIINWKKENEKYISTDIINSLNCYVIYTNNGIIKIISSKDIQIL